MVQKTLKIGTRNSPLALVQADMAKSALEKAHAGLIVEIVPIQSAADWKKNDPEVALDTQNGGKGQFAKEIELLIQRGDVDCGVHSLKDMDSNLPEGLVINHYLPRANPRDAFISHKVASIMDLPEGASLGTCSPRRAAFALMKRPDLNIVPFRGNVQTRLNKVKSGQVDATYLAMAGLGRLNIQDKIIHEVSAEDMLPACGQGIVCLEMRQGDDETACYLNEINDFEAQLCAEAERSVLRILDGNCHTPIGAFAAYNSGSLEIKAMIANLEGTEFYTHEFSQACMNVKQAIEIGQTVGAKLKSQAPKDFF